MERIYHTWDRWECYPAGFYEERPPKGMTHDECRTAYAEFLRDLPRFRRALKRVIAEWKNSCEHYLTNINMNRIAWLGQAAMCIDAGVPSRYRSGYYLLTEAEQEAADLAALEALNEWLQAHEEEALTIEGAASRTVANLY